MRRPDRFKAVVMEALFWMFMFLMMWFGVNLESVIGLKFWFYAFLMGLAVVIAVSSASLRDYYLHGASSIFDVVDVRQEDE